MYIAIVESLHLLRLPIKIIIEELHIFVSGRFGLEFWFHHFLAMWPWPRNIVPVSIDSLSVKCGAMPTSLDLLRLKRMHARMV